MPEASGIFLDFTVAISAIAVANPNMAALFFHEFGYRDVVSFQDVVQHVAGAPPSDAFDLLNRPQRIRGGR